FTAKLLQGLNPENSIDGWVTNYILADSIRKNMLNISQSPVFHNSGDAIILTTNTPTKSLDGRWKKTPPYRALSYFTEQEKDGVFFHGRTRLTDELIDRVRTNNFVAVLGASGSGKSSLLRAGLLYQLKRGQKISGSDRWSYIKPFTPSSSPLGSLQKAVNIKGEKLENLTEKLIDFIKKEEAEKKVLMVIDQFEECFTLCKNDEKRREFFDCFLSVLRSEKTQNKFCLVLGMRADFLDQCSKYSGLATEIKEHQLLVTPLEKDEIEEAIKKPAELVGMGVEAKLVAQMAEDFLRNPGSLPLLQYTLDALWKYATQGEDKSKYLTLASYEKLGGIQGTLTKQADAVFEGLNKEKKSVAKRIFLELVQPGERSVNFLKVTDTRRRVILEKLPNKQHSLELLLEVSDNLADPNNRLITKDKSEKGTLLDIIHEDLIRSWKTLRGWVEEYQEALPVERKIEADAAEWEKDGRNKGLLLRVGKLSKAEEYVRKYGDMGLLDGLAYEFIEASRELRIREEEKEKVRKERELEQEKKARKLAQRRNQILGVSLVLMTGLFGYAWMQQNIAKRNSEISFVGQLAAKAELLSTNNFYDTTVLLGVQSMNKIQEFKQWRDSGWRKVVRKFLGSQFSVVPQNAADGAIRKGLTQLPDHLLNHEGRVTAVAFSPDGKTIATASLDNTARLWDPENGNVLATLYHQDYVRAVAFSPDGKTIATTSDDKTARLWDTENGNVLATLYHQNWVKAVAFSPDGKTIATASDDKTARLWDTENGNVLATLYHQREVNAVAFSPDGKTIATASYDGTARLWDTENGNELATLYHQSRVYAVAFSPDGKTIATASWDKTARLWDTDNGNVLATLNHQDWVNAVAFSPDGKTIATASYDYTARLWDTENGNELATLYHRGWVNAVAFSPDGKTIATASYDKTAQTARLWDTENGNKLATLYHQREVNAVAFSPDGKTIATASYDKTARLWDTENGNELATLLYLSAVAFSPDGKTIATASWDKTAQTARLWDTENGNELATLNHQDRVKAVAFSPDGKTIATLSDKTARLWDTENGNELATLNHQDSVYAVALSPDGKTIATRSEKTARLWDTENGNEVATLNHQYSVYTVAFSPDGKTIATGSYDGTARLWDTENGNELATLYHRSTVIAVAFSPDGKTIATAIAGNTAHLWDTENGNELATLNHQDTVWGVAFSPDGKTIATASNDKTARLWDTENGNLLATLLHQDRVKAVAFSPDGKTVATTSNDNTARLWDTENGNLLATLLHLSAVAFSPDGKTIATISGTTARLHWATPEGLTQEACRRLSRNLTAEEWQQYINTDLTTYQKTCDELPVHPSLILGLIAEAKNLAKTGEKPKIKEAISLYDQAQKLDSDVEIDVENWIELCWFGSLNNHAQDVMFACEKAVKLKPNDINNDINIYNDMRIHLTRGFARALTGDYQGSIDDFQVLVDTTKDEEKKATWEGVIEILKKGVNPWTSEVLEEIKKNQTD
ncbi:MAG: NACHT domain-containing protein, partial [Trichodesmium sp. MAG_R03]|nr:NACHT domain-containing protein [Trichodesmium sp. MAG_R03]